MYVGCMTGLIVILNQVFRENGYYTIWNEYDNKISTVIETQDLPREVLKKWYENIKSKNLDLGLDILDLDRYKEVDDSVDDSGDIADKDSGDDNGDKADKERGDETRCLYNCICINCEAERNE